MAFLLTDIKDFLEICTKELDETFSRTTTFPRMSKALMEHVHKMKLKIKEMRRYGQFLSPGKAATLLEKGTVKATTVNIKDLNLLCLLYWTSALIFQSKLLSGNNFTLSFSSTISLPHPASLKLYIYI